MQFRKSSSQGRIFAILAATMLVMSSLWAGTTGKIAGRVYNSETGDPLPGANIIVTGTTLGTSSDQDGSYFIINVPPGTYTVKASFIGYEGINASNVRVTADRTTELVFAMNSSVIEGSEVTITAERPMIDKDLTGSMQVVSSDDLDRSWARSLPEIMELLSGVSDGHYRGGTHLENVYMLNNVSLNSGPLSDNYTGINISTIEEVIVLTGGYNAEYGSAQSAIVNVITKEAPKGIHATVVTRMRPAGKYHWGRNIYSRENYDWKFYDREFWADEKMVDGVRVRPPKRVQGLDPDSLLAAWQNIITPDPAQGDYAERVEYETEATIFGSLSDRLGFLISGRFKRGVNIFPQQFAYNPEHNIQMNLKYKLSNRINLSYTGLTGGYETSGTSASNFNSLENSEEMEWMGLPTISDPYDEVKYAPITNPWGGWPELRTVNSHTLKLTHAFSNKSFYEVWGNLLLDKMDRTDRWGYVSDDHWGDWNSDPMLRYYLIDIRDEDDNLISPKHYTDEFSSSVLNLGASYTSQVNNNNMVKAGFEYKSYDLDYYHMMSAIEGGDHWWLGNVYEGTPYEGAAYVQDKVEFEGLIVNAGLRLNFFNQNRDAAKNMFDPLAYEETTPGNIIPGIPGVPETKATEMQYAIGPRLGISHPINENTVLHFTYGHFYQRPTWHKMLGFPFFHHGDFVNEDGDTVIVADDDLWAGQQVLLSEWQGYQGNPLLGYAKTIQYEIGFDQNIGNMFRLDVTAFYKDASRQTEPSTALYSLEFQSDKALMAVNSGYADMRGIESSLSSNFNFPLNFHVAYDITYSNGGSLGFEDLWEDGSPGQRNGYGMWRRDWVDNHSVKTMVNLDFYENWGPSIAGIHPLENLHTNVYFEYRNGDEYTYHPPGDTTTTPNNRRWMPHFRTNLKVAKVVNIFGAKTEFSVEVRNLFNNKDIVLPWWDNDAMIRWHEKTELSEQDNKDGLTLEEARLPRHWYSGEPDIWGSYNNYTNPPRQLFFQLKVDI